MSEEAGASQVPAQSTANGRRQLGEAVLATALLLPVGWVVHTSSYALGAIVGQCFGVALLMTVPTGKRLRLAPWHRFLWLIGSGLIIIWLGRVLPNRCPPTH